MARWVSRPSSRRRPRRVSVLTVVAASATVFAGFTACGSSGAGPSDAGENTITWYASPIDQVQNDYRQVLIDEFENAYPSIKVRLISGPTETGLKRQELTGRIRSGRGAPDVYLGDVIWPAEFARAGLARPLDQDFDRSFWCRFRDNARTCDSELRNALTYGGKTYAAPFFVDQGLLFYRTDLVATPPKTWEDLERISRDLIRAHRVRYGFVWQGKPYEGLTCFVTELLADAGGRVLAPDGTRSEIDASSGSKALSFLRGLITDGITPREVTSYDEPYSKHVFTDGQAAFMRIWNSAYARVNTPRNPQIYGKVGVAPLPTFAGPQYTAHSTFGGWALYINPHTHHLDAAEKFVRWLTDVPAQQILARFSQVPTNFQVRATNSTFGSPAVVTALHVNRVARPSNTPKYAAISAVLYHNALETGRSVPETLRTMQKDIDTLVQR